MKKDTLESLLGQSKYISQLNPLVLTYALVSGRCGNAGRAVNIRIENNRVSGYGFSSIGEMSPWITQNVSTEDEVDELFYNTLDKL